MGIKKCIYKECGIRYRADVEVSFHKLPSGQDLFVRWLYAMRWKETWLPIKKYDVICSAHFTNDCFTIGADGFKKRLKAGSIPTIFDPVIFRPRQGLPAPVELEPPGPENEVEEVESRAGDETSVPGDNPVPPAGNLISAAAAAAAALHCHDYAHKQPSNACNGDIEMYSTGSSSEDDEDKDETFPTSTSLPRSAGLKYCKAMGLGRDLAVFFGDQEREREPSVTSSTTPPLEPSAPQAVEHVKAKLAKIQAISKKRRQLCAARKAEITRLRRRVHFLESKLDEIKKVVDFSFGEPELA